MATTVTLKPNAIDLSGSTSGTTTLQANAVAGTTTITLPAATDTLVGKATTDTLTNKTLTAPVISTISNTGTLTLPTSTDTLVGRATTDTLTNKTLTSPTITGGALNGTLGATTPSTVAATTISASGTTTLSGNQIISVTDNSNAALRITQLGTGNALLVEDSTNPDASPFVVTADGRFIHGHTSALSPRSVTFANQFVGPDFSGSAPLSLRYSNDASPTGYEFSKTRSTTPSGNAIVSSGDSVGQLIFSADDGTQYVQAANITGAVDGTPGTNDMPGRLVFSTTADGASSPTERMRIDSSGRVLVGLTSANTSGANFQVSSGVTFPATQSASSDANTLDDYEEGTWTPTLKFGGGTTGITYSQQFGQYTKIGRLVTCTFNIFLTSKGSSAGSASIDNLPFTVFNGNGYYAGAMLQPYKINYVDGGMITMYIDKQNNALYLQSIPDTGAANTDIASGDFNNDSQVIGSFIYYV